MEKDDFSLPSSPSKLSGRKNEKTCCQNTVACLSIWKSALLAWISLALAQISGPIFKYMIQQHIPPMLSASWRNQSMLIFLSLLSIIELKIRDIRGEPRVNWFGNVAGMRFSVAFHVVIGSIFWSMNVLLWILALKYTTTVRASVLSCLHPLILVLYLHFTTPLNENNVKQCQSCMGNGIFFKIFNFFGIRGSGVSLLEWLGVLVCILGLVVVSGDSFFDTKGKSSSHVLLGDVMCLIAACADAALIINRKEIKTDVPVFQYTAWTCSGVTLLSSVFSVLFEGTGLNIGSIHSDCASSLLGWTSHDWLPTILMFGLVVGVITMVGFNYALEHISPLVFAAVALTDPAITGLISWAYGIEGMPDLMTLMGGGVVMIGIGVITYGEHKRSESASDPNVTADKSNPVDIEYELVRVTEDS